MSTDDLTAQNAGTTVRLVRDARFGYRRVEPPPTAAEVERYYDGKFYQRVQAGARAPDLKKLMAGGETSARERAWLEATFYEDIAAGLARFVAGGRVIDIGCGSGDLVEFLGHRGYRAEGIEPSLVAVAHARERGLSVRRGTVESLETEAPATYDAATMIGVLETVVDPLSALVAIRRCLRPKGILFLRVGNQFNALQETARRVLGVPPWWVVVPEHLSYFDYASLERLLQGARFAVEDRLSDFPMEMFLLMGENYIADNEVGAACHSRRMAFELSIDAEVRRRMYRAFAASGIGRSILVFARAA